MKFSLSGFKKVSKTPDTTTLMHPSGHELTIKHTILSPKLRGDIEALPHISEHHPDTDKPKAPTVAKFAGGTPDVPVSKGGYDPDLVKSLQTTGQLTSYKNEVPPSTPKPAPSPTGEATHVAPVKAQATADSYSAQAKGGEIKKYAEGTKDTPVQAQDNGPDAADKRVTEQNQADSDKQSQNKADTTEKDKYERAGMGSDYDAHKTNAELLKQQGDSLAAHIQATPVIPGQQPSSTPQQSVQPVTPQDQSASGVGQMVQPTTPQDQAAAGINQPVQPSDQTSQPSGQVSTPNTGQTQSSTSNSTQPMPSAPGTDTTNMNNKVQNYEQYVLDSEDKSNKLLKAAQSGEINPNRLFNNMDTPTRIGNIIGLVLGGISSGHNGGKNMALEALNTAIDRDIDAQKTNKTNNMNLYKMNLEATKNETEARNMTVNQYLTMFQAAMAKQAAGITNAQGLKNLELFNENIKAAKFQNDLNGYKANMLNNSNSADTSNIPPGQVDMKKFTDYQRLGLMPKEDVEAATKESNSYLQNRAVRNDYNETFKALNDKFLAGALTPADRAAAINTLAAKMEHANVGRYNHDAVVNMVNGMFPKAGDLASTRRDKQMYANKIFDINESETGTLDRYHLKAPSVPTSSNPVIATFMRDNPQVKTIQDATRILKQNGKL